MFLFVFCRILSGHAAIKKFAVRPKLKVGGGGILVNIHAYNVFLKNIMFCFFLRRVIFLANTQCAGKNFYHLLSMRAVIFTAYSVCVKEYSGQRQ
jgi:hypothetical protein